MTFVPHHARTLKSSGDSADDTLDTYVAGPLAYALRKDPGGTGQGHNTNYVAAPLSHGSNPNSNMAGRRREDDENLVTAFYPNEGGTGKFHRDDGVSPTLKVGSGIGAANGMAITSAATGVRRLTPTECERLQALPDDWTAHGPDSRRYAALGDAVTASVGRVDRSEADGGVSIDWDGWLRVVLLNVVAVLVVWWLA